MVVRNECEQKHCTLIVEPPKNGQDSR